MVICIPVEVSSAQPSNSSYIVKYPVIIADPQCVLYVELCAGVSGSLRCPLLCFELFGNLGKMRSFQSHTLDIVFGDTGYILPSNVLIHRQALYKINNKNKVMSCRFDYICCVSSCGIP
jgi:hypothetical protein